MPNDITTVFHPPNLEIILSPWQSPKSFPQPKYHSHEWLCPFSTPNTSMPYTRCSQSFGFSVSVHGSSCSSVQMMIPLCWGQGCWVVRKVCFMGRVVGNFLIVENSHLPLLLWEGILFYVFRFITWHSPFNKNNRSFLPFWTSSMAHCNLFVMIIKIPWQLCYSIVHPKRSFSPNFLDTLLVVCYLLGTVTGE